MACILNMSLTSTLNIAYMHISYVSKYLVQNTGDSIFFVLYGAVLVFVYEVWY